MRVAPEHALKPLPVPFRIATQGRRGYWELQANIRRAVYLTPRAWAECFLGFEIQKKRVYPPRAWAELEGGESDAHPSVPSRRRVLVRLIHAPLLIPHASPSPLSPFPSLNGPETAYTGRGGVFASEWMLGSGLWSASLPGPFTAVLWGAPPGAAQLAREGTGSAPEERRLGQGRRMDAAGLAWPTRGLTGARRGRGRRGIRRGITYVIAGLSRWMRSTGADRPTRATHE